MKGTGGFLHPEKVISQLGLKTGDKVADFGCGTGYFTTLIAQAIGPEGLVWACDVLAAPLEVVNNKAKAANIFNLKTVQCNLETPQSSQIQELSLDWVICANILFQSQKKEAILTEAKRVLKPQANLVIIDWQPQASLAPKQGWLLSQNQALELAQAQGFSSEKEIDAGKYHWGIILVKN